MASQHFVITSRRPAPPLRHRPARAVVQGAGEWQVVSGTGAARHRRRRRWGGQSSIFKASLDVPAVRRLHWVARESAQLLDAPMGTTWQHCRCPDLPKPCSSYQVCTGASACAAPCAWGACVVWCSARVVESGVALGCRMRRACVLLRVTAAPHTRQLTRTRRVVRRVTRQRCRCRLDRVIPCRCGVPLPPPVALHPWGTSACQVARRGATAQDRAASAARGLTRRRLLRCHIHGSRHARTASVLRLRSAAFASCARVACCAASDMRWRACALLRLPALG